MSNSLVFSAERKNLLLKYICRRNLRRIGLLKTIYAMKKGMLLSAAYRGRGPDVGFVRRASRRPPQPQRVKPRLNGSPATGSRFADDDNNDAHGRRLLIAKAGRGCVCCRHGPVGRLRISKSSTEFDRPQAGGYSRDCAQDF